MKPCITTIRAGSIFLQGFAESGVETEPEMEAIHFGGFGQRPPEECGGLLWTIELPVDVCQKLVRDRMTGGRSALQELEGPVVEAAEGVILPESVERLAVVGRDR